MAGTITIAGPSGQGQEPAGLAASWLPDRAAEIVLPAPADATAIATGVRAVLAAVDDADLTYVGPGYPPVDDPLAVALLREARAQAMESVVLPATPFWMGALEAGSGFSVRSVADVAKADLSAPVVVSGLMTAAVVGELVAGLRGQVGDVALTLVSLPGKTVTIPAAGVEGLEFVDGGRPYALIAGPVAPLANPAALDSLLWVVERLRAPDGCPWDRRQTHESLRRYLPEEAHEAASAIADRDPAHLAEELGDVLLQIALHAQIASESGDFDFSDVVRSITEKIVHRHPHVFGDVAVDGVDDVLRNWEDLKEAERAAGGDARPDVSPGLPALTYAREVLKRAARAGEALAPAVVDGALAGAEAALEGEERATVLGELLLHLVELAGRQGLDAEFALREALLRRMPKEEGT